MRTEICDRLGIEFPIFAFSHCRDVVAAVTNAGGLGVLGALAFEPDALETELAWLDDHVGDRPYGVDIVIPSKYEGWASTT
jgi:NAD(P)H-dependent flavin oxidoreductase YrpB (nitropropane dioxygenase family)